MTEKMLKDALQEVKLSDEKKRQILKKVKMQKGQKVSYGRRKKLAIATVGFACVICVGFFYSLDHLTMENPSGEKEGLQMSTTGENTSTNDLEEENEENVVEEQIVWKVQGINKKEVVLSKWLQLQVFFPNRDLLSMPQRSPMFLAFPGHLTGSWQIEASL